MVATQGVTYDSILCRSLHASSTKYGPRSSNRPRLRPRSRTRTQLGGSASSFVTACLPSRLRRQQRPGSPPRPSSMFSQRTMEQTARVNCGAPKSNRQTDAAATAHALAARRVSLWVSCQAFEASVKLIRLLKCKVVVENAPVENPCGP